MVRRCSTLLLGLPLGLGLLGIAPPGRDEAASAVASSTPSMMESYDPERAGHPLRIVAYALHPVGVILDYALFRPAYWLGSHEPLRTLFGRRDDE